VTEVLARGQTKTTREETSETMTALERTAAGTVRLEMSDGTQVTGYLFVDERGRLQDFAARSAGSISMASEARLKDLLRRIQSYNDVFERRTFVLGQSETMDLSYFLGLYLPRGLAELAQESRLAFVGIHDLAGRRMAALRLELARALASAVPLSIPDRPNESILVHRVACRVLPITRRI
jgi:hypothetical protein